MMQQIQIFKIDELIFDGEYYPRATVNHVTIGNYAMKMKTGIKFPPIRVGRFNKKLYVVDGWHRCHAVKRNKEEYISGILVDYKQIKDLFVDAIKYNTEHGLPLSSFDQVKIVAKLEDLMFSPLEIGELIVATSDRVQKYKNRILRKPNGSKVFLKAPIARLLEKGHITEEEAMLADQSSYQVQDVKNILVQLVSLLQDHLYPWDNEDMKQLAVEAYQLLGRNITIDDVS